MKNRYEVLAELKDFCEEYKDHYLVGSQALSNLRDTLVKMDEQLMQQYHDSSNPREKAEILSYFLGMFNNDEE